MTNSQPSAHHRKLLKHAKRIVVKVGTHVLVEKNGKPNIKCIGQIVKDIARLHHAGCEVVLVTSGAIGIGMEVLNLKRTPSTPLADLQMAAAVGQTRLMEIYHNYFTKKDCIISQVLLTHDDLKNRRRHLNARTTMLNLLKHRVLPIVNENDVVSVDEIRLGDNDVLSALTSALIKADLLVLLTTPNGVLQPINEKRMARIPYLETINEDVLKLAVGKTSTLSTGGMASKLKAAQMAVKAGSPVIIASGLQKGVLKKIISGKDVGTLISKHDHSKQTYKGRKRWIAFFHRPQGTLTVHEGAQQALHSGKSLLPIGVENVAGEFPSGALVNIINEIGDIVGQGLVSYSSTEIKKIQGHHSNEIIELLGFKTQNEIIHRNNFTFLEDLK